MTTMELTPRMETVITGLRKRKAHVLAMGQNIQQLYPLDKITPEVFENITVPIPLPIALMLLGLGCEMVARTEPAKEKADAA